VKAQGRKAVQVQVLFPGFRVSRLGNRELLNALVARICYVQVALTIYSHAMRPDELPGLIARAAEPK